MWNSMEPAWQLAFQMAWESFKVGSIPIGAVISDANGRILTSGRNRTMETGFLNKKMAHAEMDALLQLDSTQFPTPHSYIIHTTMEPCPMCMGSIVMSNLRTIRSASRDTYAGATHYSETDPYTKSKNMRIHFESGFLETTTLVLQTYYELRSSDGNSNRVLEALEKNHPTAFSIASGLYSTKTLDAYVQQDADVQAVIQLISDELLLHSEKVKGENH